MEDVASSINVIETGFEQGVQLWNIQEIPRLQSNVYYPWVHCFTLDIKPKQVRKALGLLTSEISVSRHETGIGVDPRTQFEKTEFIALITSTEMDSVSSVNVTID